MTHRNIYMTDELQAIYDQTVELVSKEVTPHGDQWEEVGKVPREALRQMGDLGMFALRVPEEHGGAGMDPVSYVIAVEEISAACASTGVIMSVNNSLVCDPILKFGTEEQKREFLVPLASGERLGCFGLSEPEAGSAREYQTKRKDRA